MPPSDTRVPQRSHPDPSLPASPGRSTPDLPPLPDLPPRWPAAVRAELTSRHGGLVAALADTPADRVLDLSVPEGRHVLAQAIVGGGEPMSAGPFERIVSVAGFTRFPDLGAALETVVSLLAPAGELWAVEPADRPGPVGLAFGSLGALLPAARGTHLARDVPGTVRSVGLVVTDIRRFTVSTPVWPLRTFVDLRAARCAPPDGSGSVGDGGEGVGSDVDASIDRGEGGA